MFDSSNQILGCAEKKKIREQYSWIMPDSSIIEFKVNEVNRITATPNKDN